MNRIWHLTAAIRKVVGRLCTSIDVSHGLLCVIEEGDKRWLKWIELQPIPPRDYVNVHVSYDLQRLNIGLRPRTLGPLPLGLEQEPIPVAWEIDRLIDPSVCRSHGV